MIEEEVSQSIKTVKLKGNWLLHQHNDPKHTSKFTMNRFRLKLLEWPSQTFGLNITGNLWADGKHTGQPKNITELE